MRVKHLKTDAPITTLRQDRQGNWVINLPALHRRARCRQISGWSVDIVICHDYDDDSDDVSVEYWENGEVHIILDEADYAFRKQRFAEEQIEMGDGWWDWTTLREVTGYDIKDMVEEELDKFRAIQRIFNLEVTYG